ncbi:MAG: twin-arginine translocation signal domain-containing protein, partial [Chloroflexi bacterium]|nr:twin-arginine translocation signal domain-containing protein [Chloroflexota bacterium]
MGEISRRDFLKLSGLGALAALLPNRGRKTAFQPQHYPTVEHIDPRFGVLMTVDDGYSRTFVPMADVFFRRQVPIAFFV